MEGNKFVKHGNSANASRRVLVLMLSIMLVVSSISSSFAASSKATKEGDVKTSSFMKKTVREPKLCTVSFSAFGADNVPEPVKVPKGEKLGSNYPKEVPTKNGYICIGWTDGIFSMNEPNVDENYVVNNNMTLYAVWRSIINVTFDSPDHSVGPPGPRRRPAPRGAPPSAISARRPSGASARPRSPA